MTTTPTDPSLSKHYPTHQHQDCLSEQRKMYPLEARSRDRQTAAQGLRLHLRSSSTSTRGEACGRQLYRGSDRSEGFPRSNNKKVLCVRLWKGACFCRRVLLSSFFFLLLSSLTQNRSLKMNIFVGKTMFWGGPGEGPGRRGRGGTKKKKKKKWRKKNEKQILKNDKLKK